MEFNKYFLQSLKSCVFDRASIHALRKDKSITVLSISLLILSAVIAGIAEWLFNEQTSWMFALVFTPIIVVYFYAGIYVLVRAFGSKESYQGFLRVDGPVSFLFGLGFPLQYVPVIGFAVFPILGAWNLVLSLFIVKESFKITWGKSVLILVILLSVLFAIGFLLAIFFGALAYFGFNPFGFDLPNLTLPTP